MPKGHRLWPGREPKSHLELGSRLPRLPSRPASSILNPRFRGVAQLGSASALGAEGRWFESSRPDHLRGCGSTVEPQPSKLMTRVRLPSPAPNKTAGQRWYSLWPALFWQSSIFLFQKRQPTSRLGNLLRRVSARLLRRTVCEQAICTLCFGVRPKKLQLACRGFT